MPKTKDFTSSGRREQILDEALRLFLERGVHGVTTRDIAHAVGISQPSLYAHFPTRETITVELCCRAFAELHASLEAAARTAGDVTQRLRSLSETYIEFGLRNAAAYQVAFMLALPAAGHPLKGRILAAGVKAFGVLRKVFDDVEIDDVQRDAMAQSAWASLHGLVSLLLVRQEFPWVDRNTLIEGHIAAICHNVRVGRRRNDKADEIG